MEPIGALTEFGDVYCPDCRAWLARIIVPTPPQFIWSIIGGHAMLGCPALLHWIRSGLATAPFTPGILLTVRAES